MATNNNTLSKEEIIKLYRQRGKQMKIKLKRIQKWFQYGLSSTQEILYQCFILSNRYF